MKIFYNGEVMEVAAVSLDGLLRELDLEGQGVATAVNGDFVPRSLRAEKLLIENDHIEVVAPMQGG